MSRGVRPLSAPLDADSPRSGACWTTVVVCPPPRCSADTMPIAAAQPSTADTTATGIWALHRIGPKCANRASTDAKSTLRLFESDARVRLHPRAAAAPGAHRWRLAPDGRAHRRAPAVRGRARRHDARRDARL